MTVVVCFGAVDRSLPECGNTSLTPYLDLFGVASTVRFMTKKKLRSHSRSFEVIENGTIR